MREGKLALNKLTALADRYKFPLLILLIGLALVLFPFGGKDEEKSSFAPTPTDVSEPDDGTVYLAKTEARLENLLSQIEGAGRVRVMLTLETGPASNFQTDRSESRSTESDRENRTTEEKTVMMDRGSAYDEPAVVSTAFPVFRGALIVAEGGDDPVIRYQLSAAVAALLDLGADQITVVKMK